MISKKSLARLLLIAALILTVLPTLAQDAFPPADLTSPAAPFIYSHDYAISVGASAEWQKLEGVASDPIHQKVYFAVTSISGTMADSSGGIRLQGNTCGAVFVGTLDGSYDTAALTQAVIGGPYDSGSSTYPCNADAIANPDNIAVDPSGNLWIGEDGSFHHNQMLWMWDGTTLRRFATLPEGAEVTGLHITANGVIFLNVQHPSASNPAPFNRSTVGVITGYTAGDAFTPLPIPTGTDMQTLKLAAGTYQIIGQPGDLLTGSATTTFGQITAAFGGTLYTCPYPDGNMFLPSNPEQTQGTLYINWECAPGAVSKVSLSQDVGGTWTVSAGERVNFTGVGGTWTNCNASVTPWNTALTSEEFPPDIPSIWTGWLTVRDLLTANIGYEANPLNYGYIIEMTPSGGGGSVVVKHYVMGRFSHEQALIMPDSRTSYFGDDGSDRVLYKFVADSAGDLSAGTLYAAQVTTQADGTLTLSWIALGSSSDAAIAATLGILNVQLSVQGRTNPAPDASRVITTHVRMMPDGGGAVFYSKDFTSDASSAFTAPSLALGTYLFSFKGSHTLARQVTLTIGAGMTRVSPPVLLEGDADDNNSVTITDFAILAAAFGKTQGQAGYDGRTDFNGDSAITITDFSLLAANFGMVGDGGVATP